MTVFYIEQEKPKRNTAGAKAPADINALCEKRGYTAIVFPALPQGKPKLYNKAWLAVNCTKYWNRVYDTVSRDDVVLVQHPLYGNRVSVRMIPKIQKEKGCKFVALIHDLESLRKGIAGVVDQSQKTSELADNQLLKCFDSVICHNEKMKAYLVSQGFDPDRLVSLEIFDYLSDYVPIQQQKGAEPSIMIAGNLAPSKCGYIYNICKDGRNKNLTVHLFGNHYEQPEKGYGLNYHGSFAPEQLPQHLEGDFGLVWDGTSEIGCQGNTGEYLKYNNPHKTSLYLSSGFPVIVWKQSAMASFVLSHQVGIAVEDLTDLNEKIASITEEEYQQMASHAIDMAEKLHNGFFFYRAMDQVLGK